MDFGEIGFMVFDAAGAPKTNASPLFTVFRGRSPAADRTPPTGSLATPIPHRGGGSYGVIASIADVAAATAFVIELGTGAFNASGGTRVFGAVAPESTPLFAQLFEDSSGALWAGAAPTLGIWNDFTGAVISPQPSVDVIAGAYLYGVSPSASEVAAGRLGRLDAPAGAFPQYPFFTAYAYSTLAPPSIVTLSSPLQSFAAQQDFGIDISTYPDLDASFSLLQGNRVLAENVVRRWTCGQGALLDAPDIGIDIRQYLNDAGVMGNLGKSVMSRMKTAMENEAKRDSRVANCVVDLQWNQNTQTILAKAELDAAGGPFKLELAVTAVTVSLLSLG